jgi:hypothetical protein
MIAERDVVALDMRIQSGLGNDSDQIGEAWWIRLERMHGAAEAGPTGLDDGVPTPVRADIEKYPRGADDPGKQCGGLGLEAGQKIRHVKRVKLGIANIEAEIPLAAGQPPPPAGRGMRAAPTGRKIALSGDTASGCRYGTISRAAEGDATQTGFRKWL